MNRTLGDRLGDSDPQVRTAAIREARYRDLKDPAVLRCLLTLCTDLAPVLGQSASVDPFAAFFGGAPPGAVRVADVAAERLLATGLPPDKGSVETIASALAAAQVGQAGRLPEVVARTLGETRWEDLEHAVSTLVPALEPHDEPLFHAITLLPQGAVHLLIERAVQPVRPRLLQELMNHEPSRPLVAAAIERRAAEATAQDVSVLAPILASWGESALSRVCALWVERFPWVVAWQAIDDPQAGPELARWLAEGAPGAPFDLFAHVSAVLRRRGLRESFPLAAWMRVAGDDLGLLDSRTVEGALEDEVAALLQSWVRELGQGQGEPARGWRAALQLVAAGKHAPVLDDLERALARTDPEGRIPWEESSLLLLAGAEPPVRGLQTAVLTVLQQQPSQTAPAVQALLTLAGREPEYGQALLREATASVLAAAEQAPWEEVRVGKGTVRRQRAGVDADSIAPWVEALADPDLRARLDAVTAVVRAG